MASLCRWAAQANLCCWFLRVCASGVTTCDQGKQTLSYRWTGWSSRLQENLPIILEELIEYTSNFLQENRRMSTCNHRLDLQTLGSQPIMPKNLLDYWLRPQHPPQWAYASAEVAWERRRNPENSSQAHPSTFAVWRRTPGGRMEGREARPGWMTSSRMNVWQHSPFEEVVHDFVCFQHVMSYCTLKSVISTPRYHSLSNIPKPYGTDVCSSNLTPYCHISLPYIMNFVINAKQSKKSAYSLALHHVSICGVSSSYSA